MKISRRVMVVLFPMIAMLAGCQTIGSPSATSNTKQALAAEQKANATDRQEVQAASVNVFAASVKEVKMYRPVPLSKEHTIYISPKPIFTRLDLVSVGVPVKDTRGNVYVRLNLNDQGIKAVKVIPKDQGFLTVIGGQVASLRGFRKDNAFYFQVRDEAAAKAITEAIIGQVK